MCSHKCPRCEEEESIREEIATKVVNLIMYLNKSMSDEEFASVRLEMINLVNQMV